MQTNDLETCRSRQREIHDHLTGEIGRMGEAVAEDVPARGNLSHVSTRAADRDSEGIEKEMSLEKTAGELLNQVKRALERIDQGTFGQCQGCGQEICQDRLIALPYTAYYVICEEKRKVRFLKF